MRFNRHGNCGHNVGELGTCHAPGTTPGVAPMFHDEDAITEKPTAK
jgi:hypothetical protein